MVRRFAWEAHRLVAHSVPGGRRSAIAGMRSSAWSSRPKAAASRAISTTTPITPKCKDSLGRRERYHFRGEGGERRWTAHERADGSRVEFGYDTLGRQISTTDVLGRRHFLRRDGEGRIVGEDGPAVVSWQAELDADGLAVEVASSDGRRRRFERDAQGRAYAA